MACLCDWQRSFLQAETSSLLPQQILSFYWRNRTSFHLPIQWYTNLQNADEKQAWIRVGVMNETTVTARYGQKIEVERLINAFKTINANRILTKFIFCVAHWSLSFVFAQLLWRFDLPLSFPAILVIWRIKIFFVFRTWWIIFHGGKTLSKLSHRAEI